MQPIRHASCLLPWNPYLPEEERDCSFCGETFLETPTTPEEIPLKHEGPTGGKHPATHLGCLRTWVQKNNLCAFCQVPLDIGQLELFLKDLRNVDLQEASLEDLARLAQEAAQLALTSEGRQLTLQTLQKSLEETIQRFEASYDQLSARARSCCSLLQEALECLKTLETTTSEEEYFLAREKLLPVEELTSSCEEVLNLLQQVTRDYTAGSRAYVLNEKTLYHLQSLSDIDLDALDQGLPLLHSSQEEIQQKGRDHELAIKTVVEEARRIGELHSKIFRLGFAHQRDLNRKVCLIIVPAILAAASVFFLEFQLLVLNNVYSRFHLQGSTRRSADKVYEASALIFIGMIGYISAIAAFVFKTSKYAGPPATEFDRFLQKIDDLVEAPLTPIADLFIQKIELPARKAKKIAMLLWHANKISQAFCSPS